jgi:hypothetical protein
MEKALKLVSPLKLLLLSLFSILCIIVPAHGASVTLAWDASSGADGYRLFYREDGQSYNYGSPDWEGPSTTCSISGLDENTTYHFVVRAYNEEGQSGNSNEEHLYPSGTNLAPNQPVITSPKYGEAEADLLLTVDTEPFSDPDRGDSHIKSRWQIVHEGDFLANDFSSPVLDITDGQNLTKVTVPHTVLDRDTTYYVRVKFYDSYSAASDWSDAVQFTTDSTTVDLDADGIPDDQEVDNTVDLNGDLIADNDQPELIKSAQTAVAGNIAIGICEDSDSIDAIEMLETINPSEILDNKNKPENFIYGLFSYRLRVKQAGDTASVRIYYSEDISLATHFFKYDNINGWQDYTLYTTFNQDGRSVTVDLKDGGHGDSDGVANGIIVDPGGVVEANSSGADSNAGGGSGCFIATAAFGSKMERHVKILTAFRDKRLLPTQLGRRFVDAYYRFSPPVADYLRLHPFARAAVRYTLISYSFLPLS